MTDEEFEVQLPDWVKVLLEKAEEKGYDQGRSDGQRWQFERSRRAIEGTDPR